MDISASIPIPHGRLPKINRERAALWVAKEPDQKIAVLKRKLIQSIEAISFKDFFSLTRQAAGKVAALIGDKKYGVLYGDKPHSSEAWVYHLIEDELPRPEWCAYVGRTATKQRAWGRPGWQPMTSVMIEEPPRFVRETINARRIETFLFPDDLSLSGLQMVERVKSFLRYFAAYWPDRSPTVIIMVPIATNRLREYLFSDCSHTDYDICERRGCTLLHRALVQIISTHSILTVGDRLRRDGYSVGGFPNA